MKRAALLFVALLVALAACAPAVAQFAIPMSVVGSGGGVTSGGSFSLVGTVGQPAIGVASGPANINEIGFWYMPGWILTGVEEVLPTRFALGQNHPNPFNPVTTLGYSVKEKTRVTIRLYDVAGREVATLVDEVSEPGFRETVLDAGGLSSGVYFARMVAGRFVETRKLVLLK